MALTLRQEKRIEKEIYKLWDEVISKKIITKKQKKDKGEMREIAFDMEEILQRFAARFGLAGLT